MSTYYATLTQQSSEVPQASCAWLGSWARRYHLHASFALLPPGVASVDLFQLSDQEVDSVSCVSFPLPAELKPSG